MKKILAVTTLLLLSGLLLSLRPQTGGQVVVGGQSVTVITFGAGAPSGNCLGLNYLYVNTSNGDLYSCPNPNAGWVKVSGGGGGSGTVSANNGSAGAITNYAAAGGSTTVGPDAALTDASNTLTYTGSGGIVASAGGLTSGATGVGGTITVFGGTTGSNAFTAPGNGTQLNTSATTFAIGGASAGTLRGGTNLTLNALNGNVILSPTAGNTVATITNCAAVGTAANPSVASCTSAIAGSFSCATNASTGTCQVNTTAVTANSEIFITQRSDATTGTRLGVTCNATLSTVIPEITAVTAASSFTINLGTITTNPECFSYSILN
jgi:hypothetical protein